MLYTLHSFETLWKRFYEDVWLQYRPSCSQPALLLGSPCSKSHSKIPVECNYLMKITCLKLQRAPSDTGLAMTIAWMASAKAFQVSVELVGTTRFTDFMLVPTWYVDRNQVFNSELQCLLGSSQEEGKAYFLQKKYQEAWMIIKKYQMHRFYLKSDLPFECG